MTTRALLFAAAASVLTPGCTLVGLWNIPLGGCDEPADCEPLNQRDGRFASDCQRWTCGVGGRCVLGPRDLDGDLDPDPACDPSATDCDDRNPRRAGALPETCDGIDNDCNQVVDDDSALAMPAVTVLATLASTDRTGYSASSSGALGLLASGGGEAQFVAVQDGASTGALDVAHAAQPPPPCVTPPCASGQIANATLAVGNSCPVRSGDFFGNFACNEADVALDRLGADWITASVSSTGCARGRLLVGPLVSEVDPRILLRGPIARSNTWLGIDTGDGSETACTGRSRPGTSDDRLGAARPAIAGLATAPHPQALVGWLSDSVARANACGQPSTTVEVLAVLLESGPAGGGTTTWVTGAGDGIPITLGTTTGAAPPAIVALEHDGVPDGWLVAYSGTASLQVHFVAPMIGPFPDPPRLQSEADTPRTMPDFDVSEPVALAFQGDHIRMAVGSYASGNYTVGFVYDTCDGSLAFRRAVMSADARSVTFDSPVALGPGREPAIAYVSDGFVTDDFQRGGTASTGRRGGWLVSYATDAGIRATRVLELDGLPLEAEPYTVSSSASDGRPALYSEAGSSLARFAYVDARSVLLGGNATCEPATE